MVEKLTETGRKYVPSVAEVIGSGLVIFSGRSGHFSVPFEAIEKSGEKFSVFLAALGLRRLGFLHGV